MPKVPDMDVYPLPARAADTETTGVDFYHEAKPFLVTVRDRGQLPLYWQWPVDPYSRQPIVPPSDLDEVEEALGFHRGERVVFQGPKFDFTALASLDERFRRCWRWDRIDCTLLAGHVLDTQQFLDLTALVRRYLNEEIAHLEEAVHVAVTEARNIVRRQLSTGKTTANLFDGVTTYGQGWRIADQNDSRQPSLFTQDKMVWKADMWLPKAVAEHFGYPSDHLWHTVTGDYACGDSAFTLDVFDAQWLQIVDRCLQKLYRERLRILKPAKRMEDFGLTLSSERRGQRRTEYAAEAADAATACKALASFDGYDLELPVSGNNNSLLDYVFGATYATCVPCSTGKSGKRLKHAKKTRGPAGRPPEECKKCHGTELELEEVRGLNLNPIARSKKTGEPTFDGDVVDEYLGILAPQTKASAFLRNLKRKRQRDTAVSYMDGYARFWIPLGVFNSKGKQLWYRLHPTLNPTGTGTLRWSSSNPNEQNISNKEGFSLKYIFGPAPGREWWSLDAKNIELRIPAYVSGQREFIDLFERPLDPPYFGSNHFLIAHILYPKQFEDKRNYNEAGQLDGRIFKLNFPTIARDVKAGNFCVQYGGVNKADGTGTADRTYGFPGAQTMIESRFTSQSELNQSCIAFAQEHGYVETLPDRTVDPERGYPIACEFNWRGEVKPTVPLNYFVQGSAMWWTARAMVRVDAYLERVNKGLPTWEFRSIMQGHDELVFDFPKGTGKEPWRTNLPIIMNIKKLMERGGPDFMTHVPTPVKVEYNPSNWSEGLVVCP